MLSSYEPPSPLIRSLGHALAHHIEILHCHRGWQYRLDVVVPLVGGKAAVAPFAEQLVRALAAGARA